MKLLLLCTLVTALIVDVDEPAGRETRRYQVQSGSKVAIHWTCTPRGDPWAPHNTKPAGCRDVARLDGLRAFSRCAGAVTNLPVASDTVDTVAIVDAGPTGTVTYYASLNRTECLNGVRFALRATRRARPRDGGVPVLSAAGDAFLEALDGAREARDDEEAEVAWVRDPAARWWADCRHTSSATACESLALMLASRIPRVVAAASQVAPRRRRLGRDASVFYRAEHAEEYWPAWRERNPSAAAPPLVTTEARSAAASVSLRGWLTEDYRALAALERRGALPPELATAEAGRINFLHIPKTGGTTIEAIARDAGYCAGLPCGVWGSHMIALSEYQGVVDGPRRGARGRPVQPWGSYWHQKVCFGVLDPESAAPTQRAQVYASPISPDGEQTRSRTDPKAGNMTPLAEWHCPPDILHPDRRNVMYPYPKTFCVVRDPLARLASAVYYQMENKDRRKADAGDAASFNAHIRSRMAMQMRRGHQTFFWPQSYFTPFCDVVLRFESLKRDFDGLMAKIGCPLRIPPARENRGNRLVPLLADDVVASVRRMYADDYALVERLAGLGLDELLANATSA